MANFNTHVTVATAASGLLSTIVLKAYYVSAPEALILTLGGMIGGILPDVDLKYSYPSRIIFSFLGTFAALVTVFSTSALYSILELWVLGFLVFLTIRFPLWSIFHRLTVHRGAIHSVVAGLFSFFFTSAVSYHILTNNIFFSWMLGFFVFFGFLIHLVLDEVYSVDFMNHKVKRSFGTALKIIDLRKLFNSGVIVAFTIVAWQMTPTIHSFYETIMMPENKRIFQEDFLPSYIRL